MSFCYLINGTQDLYQNKFIANVDPLIILDGDYEVGICEFFVDNITKKLGILNFNDNSLMIKIPFPVRTNYCQSLQESKLFCFDGNKLHISMDTPFSFNGQISDEGNRLSVNLDTNNTIIILSNIVKRSQINGRNLQLLKSFVYNGETYSNRNIEYYNLNRRIIKSIELRFYDNKGNEVYLSNHLQQYFVLHFRKK